MGERGEIAFSISGTTATERGTDGKMGGGRRGIPKNTPYVRGPCFKFVIPYRWTNHMASPTLTICLSVCRPCTSFSSSGQEICPKGADGSSSLKREREGGGTTEDREAFPQRRRSNPTSLSLSLSLSHFSLFLQLVSDAA